LTSTVSHAATPKLNRFLFPQLATAADLKLAVAEPKFDLTTRVLAIVAALNGLLLALLKLT
jgi:hypothetical protein